MGDEKTDGVLLRGAGGDYFIPSAELARFAVPDNPDPEGTVAANAPRVDAFAVRREPAEGAADDATAFVFATEGETDDSAEIFATEGDGDDDE